MAGNRIEAQPGFQTSFLSSPADIAIAGGAAGPGKTFALLLEFVRHVENSDWGGVIFRRTSPQITSEGGLWDTSEKIYPFLGATQKQSNLTWVFPQGSKLKFSHLEYEKNIFNWQGSQIAYIGFDELTHFTKKMFFYLLSRNRSVCGVKPYVRATCNPDPDSWIAELIEWWIDQDTGDPIPERAGIVRYLLIDGDNYIWGDTVEEVAQKGQHLIDEIPDEVDINIEDLIKSVAFIPGDIYDNKILLKENPGYLANLLAQDEQTKAQLLHGNWKVKVSEDEIIDYYALKDSFNNEFVQSGEKRITADIALQGSDKFIIGYWEGWRLMDMEIMDKSDGKDVIDAIRAMQNKYQVPNRYVAYDNDGVGGFVEGFIPGCYQFHNGSKPLNYNGYQENYEHLKAQCYYHLGQDIINRNQMYVHPRVADKMYDGKMTVRQRMIYERRAIKKYKSDVDGKIRIFPKDQMKALMAGTSPDILDMMMIRYVFELDHSRSISMSGISY